MSEQAVVKIGSNDLFGDFDYFSEGASFLILCNLSLMLHRQDKHQYPRTIETRAQCSSLLELICSESPAFRSGKGRIAPYFQGLTQRAARINSRMRQALAPEELR